MIKHYIIMSSSYTDGTRVALDITEESLLNSEAIAAMLKEIKRICGKDVPLSTHLIETESAAWESVAEYVKTGSCPDWMWPIIFFPGSNAHILPWKSWFILLMRTICVRSPSACLRTGYTRLPMGL